jgi:hypothetical protein
MEIGIKHTHSFLAYIVLIVLILAIVNYALRLRAKKDFSDFDRKLGFMVVALSHIQLLLGLALYLFFSPITKAAFQDMGEAMSNPNLRFMLMEHISANVLGVIAITVGSARAKKQVVHRAKFKNILLLFIIGLILFLSRIPWGNWWNL